MIATGLKSKSKMTYQELLHQLKSLNEEQLQQDVTVCDTEDEYFKVNAIHYANEAFNDVLDHGHPQFNRTLLNQ